MWLVTGEQSGRLLWWTAVFATSEGEALLEAVKAARVALEGRYDPFLVVKAKPIEQESLLLLASRVLFEHALPGTAKRVPAVL